MTGHDYLLMGYIAGLGLLWGYAILIWLGGRSIDRRERRKGHTSTR